MANNPWLNVPLTDYEAHMSSAGVRQLGALSELFGEALKRRQPASVAIVGIAGGNGLDRIDETITKRVVGLDIHAAYLETVRERFGHINGLELHCLDMTLNRPPIEPAELVHAALVFEHAGAGACLDHTLELVAEGGTLSVVLQLPSATESGVSQTAIESIRGLSAGFTLIDPAWVRATLEARCFRLEYETRRSLESGKGLWMGMFC